MYLGKKSYCRAKKHPVNTKLCFHFSLRDEKLEGVREGTCGPLWGSSSFQMQAVTCWLLTSSPELYNEKGYWERREALPGILDAAFNRLG